MLVILLIIEALLLCVIFWLYLRKRNQKISRMIEEIDKVLHNEEHLYISDSEEGELAILQSEIVKMTQRIREQNDALMREKKYLADSLADIAHQLRTSLTSVTMVLSFLETTDDPMERKRLLREAENLLMRMDVLLTALLKLSRLDAGVIELKCEKILVDSLIENALIPLQIPIEVREIAIKKDIPKTAAIRADNLWLTEALQNILKNCIENMQEGGIIEITCEDTLLYTVIAIRDSGNGFPEEEIPHLFERFYRGKHSVSKGYGIGLALSKTIIDRHGGLLTAENHPSGGAVFQMKFYK